MARSRSASARSACRSGGVEERGPLSRVEIASTGARVEAELVGQASDRRAAKRTLDGEVAEGTAEKYAIRVDVVDERRRPTHSAEDRGVHTRRRCKAAARDTPHELEVELRRPFDRGEGRRPDGAFPHRESPLDDRVELRQPRIGEQAPQDRTGWRERTVRDDPERLGWERNRTRVGADEAHLLAESCSKRARCNAV